jgi:hypothetical protein
MRWIGMSAAAGLLLAACTVTTSSETTSSTTTGSTTTVPAETASSTAPARAAPRTGSTTPGSSAANKVMVIVEENKTYGQVLGSGRAPYLKKLSMQYGSATRMDAGYPTLCPSLAAYIIMTSGTDAGICDDSSPAGHPLTGDNIFRQIQNSGREWRSYAESMPADCALDNSSDGRYLVRHVPSSYYLTIRRTCGHWQVPMGSTGAGALHDDITAGRLPAYSFVTPNACDDMHGAAGCDGDEVGSGDQWLAQWMPLILSGDDFRSGRLAVILTWDEGSDVSNHIPTLVLSMRTRRVQAATAWNHCSTLRTTQELLSLPLLGCARTAASMRSAFGL